MRNNGFGCGPETRRGSDVRVVSASPPVVTSNVFAYQSYFDDTALERAILEQQPGKPIVASTEKLEQVGGYGLGLHPNSETPICVEIRGGKAGGGTKPIILKPGQVVWPSGSGGFDGFSWGLPFGWLGGGLAQLVVFQSPEADVQWGAAGEIVFQRVRIAITPVANITAATLNNARKNWPSRFPWTQALRGTGNVNQKGTPQLAIVEATRTLMTLRGKTSIGAGGAKMRMVFQGVNSISFDSAGAVTLTGPVFSDFTWPQFTQLGTDGNLFSHVPVAEAPSLVNRLGADDGGLALVDATGAAALASCYVDFVRFGRL